MAIIMPSWWSLLLSHEVKSNDLGNEGFQFDFQEGKLIHVMLFEFEGSTISIYV